LAHYNKIFTIFLIVGVPWIGRRHRKEALAKDGARARVQIDGSFVQFVRLSFLSTPNFY